MGAVRRLLLVADYQKDFADGVLGFSGTEALDGPITAKVATCRAAGDDVTLTLNIHGPDYLDTQGGWGLPVPHRLPNSGGWQLYSRTGQAMERGRDMATGKGTFPSLWLVNWLKGQSYDQVELAGLTPYLCVLSSAIMVRTVLPKAEIVVNASCTIGSSPVLYAKDLNVMKALQTMVLNR